MPLSAKTATEPATALSSTKIQTFIWDLGSGNISRLEQKRYTETTEGTDSVVLIRISYGRRVLWKSFLEETLDEPKTILVTEKTRIC